MNRPRQGVPRPGDLEKRLQRTDAGHAAGLIDKAGADNADMPSMLDIGS